MFIEDFFETLYGLAREGKVNAEGLPKSYLHTACAGARIPAGDMGCGHVRFPSSAC